MGRSHEARRALRREQYHATSMMNNAASTSARQVSEGLSRIGVINLLISKRGYKRYLEIGCHLDAAFGAIVGVDHRVGVDPVSGGTHRMTSDEFFAKNEQVFDLIFVDGDHRHPQVLRDLDNALRFLAEGGAIVMHDCLPPTAEYENKNLCGTAWRAFAKYRELTGLDAITADFDYGVGIMRIADNPSPIELPCSVDELTYDHFERNREVWMRPHDIDGVKKFIDSWR